MLVNYKCTADYVQIQQIVRQYPHIMYITQTFNSLSSSEFEPFPVQICHFYNDFCMKITRNTFQVRGEKFLTYVIFALNTDIVRFKF